MARTQSLVSATVVLLAILAVAGFLVYYLQQRSLILRENEATELYNNGRYVEAARLYQALLPKVGSAGKVRVRKQMAQCYKNLGDDPALGTTEQVELYRKALSYDGACITDPNLLKLINRK